MANLLVIYDNLDEQRGDYFEASHHDLNRKLTKNHRFIHQVLDTTACLAQSIDHYTSLYDGQTFVCVAYVHGSETTLFVDDTPFIHLQNAYLFNRTLFYACSCLSAKALGGCLIENGCTVFLGFDKTITSCNPEAEGIYQECENTFLERFLNTGATVQESLSFMYKRYGDHIAYLTQTYGVQEASILEGNLDAFQCLCSDDARYYTLDNFTEPV